VSETAAPAETEGGLAIICCGGTLPFALADAVKRRGRHVVLFPLSPWADEKLVRGYPHHWCVIGQWNRFIRLATAEGCRDVTFIGQMTRPSLWKTKPDLLAIRLMPEVIRLYRGGDDHLQSGLGRILERYGFRLVGPAQLAPELLVPLGLLAGRQPTERDRADIARGLALLNAMSPFDVGQAVVVASNHVLAVEGPENTDQMLARVAELRRAGRIRSPIGTGVLIKAPKIGQDRRIDLPAIGPPTVEAVAAAGLGGIAVAANATLVAEPERLTATAGRSNIFVIGIDAEGANR
jgi:UDP-2,3-diacylglucosamine hydrolase